jgi:hypothetical protein
MTADFGTQNQVTKIYNEAGNDFGDFCSFHWFGLCLKTKYFMLVLFFSVAEGNCVIK